MRFTNLVCITTVLTLVGCANAPTSLGRVSPKSNVVASFAGTQNYETIDKYSFVQAELLYPASNGHHRIAIGDFLLAEVFEILKANPVRMLRLTHFVAKCDSSGIFMPHALCNVEYTIQIEDPTRRIVNGSVRAVDIGNIVVKQDQFFLLPVVVSDDFFQKQVDPLLQAISSSIREKLFTSSTR